MFTLLSVIVATWMVSELHATRRPPTATPRDSPLSDYEAARSRSDRAAAELIATPGRMRSALMALRRVDEAYPGLYDMMRASNHLQLEHSEASFNAFVSRETHPQYGRSWSFFQVELPVLGDPSSWSRTDAGGGRTVLHDAAIHKAVGPLRLMLAVLKTRGGDPDPQIHSGNVTPLHSAILCLCTDQVKLECVRLLLDAGASTTHESTRREYPSGTHNAVGWARVLGRGGETDRVLIREIERYSLNSDPNSE